MTHNCCRRRQHNWFTLYPTAIYTTLLILLISTCYTSTALPIAIINDNDNAINDKDNAKDDKDILSSSSVISRQLKKDNKGLLQKKLGKDIARIEHRAANKKERISRSAGEGKKGKPMTKKKTTNKDSLKQLKKKKNKHVSANEKPISQKEKKEGTKWGGGSKQYNNKWGVSHHPSLLKETRVERVKAAKEVDGEMTVYVLNGHSNGIVLVKVERVQHPKYGKIVTSVRNGIVIMMNMMMIGTGEDHPRSRHGDHGRNLVIPLLVHQQ